VARPDDAPIEPGGDVVRAVSMAGEIERLANMFFSGVPGPVLGPTSVAAPGAAPDPALTATAPAPPRGPSALAPGGASSAVALPPVPGPLQRPPPVSAPAPKESDFRPIATLFSDQLGLPSAFSLAAPSPPPSQAPYFLDLAGLPSATPSVPAGIAPGAPAAAVPRPETEATAPDLPTAPTPAAPGYDFQPELNPAPPSAPGMFDPNTIRRDFPILDERVHGRRLVWLDNAATTQKPQSVIDRVSYFYEHENSNVHRAAHTLAARATDAYEGARDKVRRFLNAPSAKEIVFVRGATEAINLVAQSWGRRNVGPGDEIVITWLEHHANIVPWQQLCAEKGACLRVAPVDSRGEVRLDEYDKLLGPRTRIVSFAHVSNALGTTLRVRDMVDMAHRQGAVVLVDGAQAVSHMPVDVQAIDCDFYCFSGHKVFAPTGIGVLFGKQEILDAMPPWQGGGNMIADVTFDKTTYQPAPSRFEAGTGSLADAVGLGAALDYISGIGMPNIARYEHDLLEYATECLARVPGLTLIGTAPEKASVLSFVIDGVRTEDVGAALNLEGIAVRAGHHCAQPILRRFGLESTVRASLALYNTRGDVDALVDTLQRVQGGRWQPRRDGSGRPA
jgi:cysteine desulfurase/selenocysteine lyase